MMGHGAFSGPALFILPTDEGGKAVTNLKSFGGAKKLSPEWGGRWPLVRLVNDHGPRSCLKIEAPKIGFESSGIPVLHVLCN